LAILDDPLDRLALFQFEGFGQRGGADEVELAGVVGALDELDFGEVSHETMITLAISLVKENDRFFLATAETQRKTRKRNSRKRTGA
jgi:hypothetical protein